MSKSTKFSELNLDQAIAKKNELANCLVRYRVSMDVSEIKDGGNVQGLLKDLKVLGRKIAVASVEKR